MKQPYFVERELPHLVRKYMETHTMVDIDVLTKNLIDEHHKFRHKKFKPFRKSVTEAYKWNYYLMEKEEKEAAENPSRKTGLDSDAVRSEDDDQPSGANDNNGNVDDEIIDCIMKKNRKSVPEQQMFPTEAPKLVELQGISSLVQPVGQILWRMKECPKQKTYCLRLTGPENCGKTTLIRALADNMSLPLYFIKVKAVLSGGPLSSPLKKMQEELKKAREILPGVIVFHHLDLLYSRESSSSSKNEQETVASAVFDFITEMVASNSGVKLLVVAETSRPEVLDWHLNQYFTEHLHIAPPSVPDKESILKVSTSNPSLVSLKSDH
ncbi:NVL2 nucleolin binding domain [Trinorchestia longiramus]|nr:NVL2 nucleolin binding domain [Trinorchestia longiramus]